MKKVGLAVLLVSLVVVLSSCGGGGGNDGEPLSSAKTITSYSLDGITGTINETEKTIAVTMLYGTDVTALVANFTTTGASVKVDQTDQASGTTANDFTSPVTYIVTAADASTAAYTVTVTMAASAVSLPKTGQTTSYATGDDGDLEKGVAWPVTRFTVGTGAVAECVTDNLTGLMWAKNANLPAATKTWQGALDHIASMNSGDGLCGYKDWRMPNVNELESMVHAEESVSAIWLNTQGFSNVTDLEYWSSTTNANDTNYAWYVDMWHGVVDYSEKTYFAYNVWPVRTGSAYAAPAKQPQTGQTTSYAAGDDGDLAKGVEWPDPRFTVGTGAAAECVTDNLTGLMWSKSQDNISRTWADALTYVNGLSLCGYDDWRLPNRKEFRSLSNYGQIDSATWLNGQGFSDVLAYAYWSSTSLAENSVYAWYVYVFNGHQSAGSKTGKEHVWPVRSGQ